jgi:hypothetical protein
MIRSSPYPGPEIGHPRTALDEMWRRPVNGYHVILSMPETA